jgi:hypothetical protein
MGLDMYLDARRFMWAFDDGTGKDAEMVRKIREAVPELGDMRLQYVTAEAAYWRKANAVHDWFVKNVQDGKDDCGYYDVDREQLEELANICDQVLQDPEQASELLPTASGFFFGSTNYDEWYRRNVEYTRDRLRDILGREELNGWDFQYHSSW